MPLDGNDSISGIFGKCDLCLRPRCGHGVSRGFSISGDRARGALDYGLRPLFEDGVQAQAAYRLSGHGGRY